MQIGFKQSCFYSVSFPIASELGDFSITESQLQEYKDLITLNSHWQKQLSVKHIVYQNYSIQNNKPSSLIKRNQQKEFDEMIKKITYYYQEHNIDYAYNLIKQLQTSFTNQTLFDQHYDFFKQIEKQFKDVIQFSTPIHQSGWELKDEEKGVKIFTKNINGQMNILIESKVNVPVEIFLQAMVELDLFNKIIPMVQYSKEQVTVARNMKIGNFIVDIPILSSREAFFQGIGYDRLKTNGTILLYIRSIHNQPQLCKQLNYLPKFHSKTVPLDFKYISLQYTPQGPNHGVCKLCLNINLSMKAVPNWILEKILRSFSFKIFQNIMKVSMNFKGSQWQKRAISKPMLFSFFKQKAHQYFGGV